MIKCAWNISGMYTREKFFTVPLCPPQIPHGLAEMSATDRLISRTALSWCWHRVTDVSEEYLPSYSGLN